MSVSTFGIIRESNVNVEDIDIFYTYSKDRTSFDSSASAIKLDANTIIKKIKHPNGLEDMNGTYNLTLPSSIFNQKGIYNIIIKPKEIRTKIIDCGVSSGRPDIKGIVIDTSDPLISQFSNKLVNGGLVGYRIEYIDMVSKNKTPNLYRIVTSCNKCEPVSENLTNTNQKSIRYRFNDSANLMFMTLTPSSASFIKSTATPYIGSAGQEIVFYNTFFDPIMLEVEFVEQTIDTLAHALYGNQTKSMEDGTYTVYTYDTNEIYKQSNLYEIVDQFGNPLFEVKENKNTLDETKKFDIIKAKDIYGQNR